MQQQPTIGRIVHYHDGDVSPYAAIITQVWSDTCVNLAVFTHEGHTFPVTSCLHPEGGGIGQYWDWPAREA